METREEENRGGLLIGRCTVLHHVELGLIPLSERVLLRGSRGF